MGHFGFLSQARLFYPAPLQSLLKPVLAFYIPQFGVVAAYAENPAMLENALGLYLCIWGVVTILFIIASQKSSVALLCTLAVLTVDLFTL